VRARCITPLLLAAGLLATGCGDDDKPKTDAGARANSSTAPPPPAETTATAPRTSATGPDATVRDYFIALAGRDGDKACGLLTKAAQRKAVALVQKSTKKSFTSCSPALRAIVPAAEKQSLEAADVEITKSTVDGDRAKVRIKRAVSDIELTRSGGRWHIYGGFG